MPKLPIFIFLKVSEISNNFINRKVPIGIINYINDYNVGVGTEKVI